MRITTMTIHSLSQRHGSRLVLAVLALLLCHASYARAETWILTPTQDTWTIGSGETDESTHNGTGLKAGIGSGNTAISFLQFNLAELPDNISIESAQLRLVLVDASSSNGNNIFIDGYMNADATGAVGFDASALSRKSYIESAALTNEFDSELGNYLAPALGNSNSLPATGQPYFSSVSSVDDRDHLRAVYEAAGATRNVIFQLWLRPGSGTAGIHTRLFEDSELTLTANSANAPQLIIEYSIVPEPSSVMLLILGSSGVVIALTKARLSKKVARS